MSLNVCALTSSPIAPASRFRFRQQVEPLRQHGVTVTEYCPRISPAMPMPRRLAHLRRRYVAPLTLGWMAAHALSRIPALVASWPADLVWIERTIVPGFDEVVHLFGLPRVLDIDDAIWLEGITGRSAAKIAGAVNAVIAGNTYLAQWASQYCKSVHIVPTAVDADLFRPSERPNTDGRFVIGWMGSTATLQFIEGIQDALASVLRAVPESSLVVVANDAPSFPRLAGLPVRFIPWSPQTEVEALREMDVGLMPLPDDEYTRGKCSLKMLQYMAGGLPAVVSPVGMNRDLLEAGAEVGIAASSTREWVDALMQLHRDADRRRRMGLAGRALVKRDYDVQVVAGKLAAIFKSVAESG